MGRVDPPHVWIPPDQYDADRRVSAPAANASATYRAAHCLCAHLRGRRSIVVVVKASEIVRSDTYACGYTLRFPRFVAIHPSKQWDECMTLEGALCCCWPWNSSRYPIDRRGSGATRSVSALRDAHAAARCGRPADCEAPGRRRRRWRRWQTAADGGHRPRRTAGTSMHSADRLGDVDGDQRIAAHLGPSSARLP